MAKELLNGFNFNNNAIFSSIVFANGSIDIPTGVRTIAAFTPINDVAYPAGATHLSISAAFGNVDFSNDDSDVKFTNKVNKAIDGTTSAVTLTPTGLPSGTGTKIYVVEVEFFQEVNAIQYSLKNGAYNALAIILVA